jgi:acyl-CoA thioester hydrolase
MYTWDALVRVRYQETDKMGVVYYGNYYTWFEVGRSEFIRSLGFSYSDLETKGIMLPVVESHCRHMAPAVYDDLLLVRTSIKELSGARIAFDYKVIRKRDDALLASGGTMHAFADCLTFKPVNLKKRCAEYYDMLANCL